MKSLKLDMVQLSGNENPSQAKGFGVPVIKAIHIENAKSILKAKKYSADYIMVDSTVKGLFGGTGKPVDAKLVDKKKIFGKNLVFSGGLNSGNVKGIVRKFRPVVVDVASGVEKELGKKSFSKVKQFIKAVKEASA